MRGRVAIALALCASPVYAGCSDKAELAFQGLNAADAIATSGVLHHGGIEHNPLLGKHPSNAKLFAVKAATGAAHCGFRLLIEDNASGFEQVYDVVTIGIVGAGLGITIHARIKQ